jgi:hypothetical protein
VREFAEFGRSTLITSLNRLRISLFGQTAHDRLRSSKEAGLDVDLGEFRLAIGAQVFVTEALGDLVVTVVSRPPSAVA